jgi:2'-5' RNA ligase
MPLPPLRSLPRLGRLPCLWCPKDGSPCTRCGPDEDEETAPRETQPGYSGSAMLALYPPPELAEALALDGGLEPADIHLTVAYVGPAADVDAKALALAAQFLSEREPLKAMISGHARFTGGEQDCIVALADSPALEDLRADTLVVLDAAGIGVPSEHGFCAHLALVYQDEDDPDPVGRLEPVPVTFGAISAVHGKDRTDFPFAAQRGPAVEEVTIDLSNLAGIWADVYGRQDALYAAQVRKALKTWRSITAGLDVAALVAAFRREALMQPSAPAPGTDHESPQARKHHRAELRKLARSMAAGLLIGLNDAPSWLTLRDAVADALALAAGEGFASALAIAAAEAGLTGFRWAAAARAGRRAPGYEAVTAALARIIAGAITDLAGALTAAAIAGLSADEMLAAAKKVLRGGKSLGFYLTDAMARELGAAVRDLYLAAGVTKINWTTVGDSRVCPLCEDHEAHNPWHIEDFPPLPAHGGCRCWPSPAGEAALPSDLYAQYLTAA